MSALALDLILKVFRTIAGMMIHLGFFAKNSRTGNPSAFGIFRSDVMTVG